MQLEPMPVARPLLLGPCGMNRKRHSRAFRWLLWPFLLLLLFLVTCAPRAHVPLPRPVESRPVTPIAEKANRQLSTARDTLNDLRSGLDTAVAEANRLRKQKVANEAELTRMWATLTREQERAKKLWDGLQESQRTVEELQAAAIARDLEIDNLRKLADEQNARLSDAAKWRKMAEPKVAVYDFISKWMLWIAVGLFVALLLYLLVRFGPALAARLARPI